MLVLSWLWLLIVLWFEIGVFYASVRKCSWPGQDQSGNHKNILIVADPQILDRHSYPERSPWFRLLSRIVTDLNMRKSWRAAYRRFRPDYVVFLGDMMDNGRADVSDDEYERYYERFLSVFPAPKERVFYVAGNHDVGLGSSDGFSEKAVERYVSHFGPLNRVVQITPKYRLVIVDAPSLVDEDEERAKHGVPIMDWPSVGGPVEFIKDLSKAPGHEGVHNILLTHIPLSRPHGTDCGPNRERGTIKPGKGFGYENTLSSEISGFLMERVRPVLIFSGDDHDYCEVQHQGGVREVTVKSISMSMGIQKPGFQLLSVPEDGGDDAGAVDQLCLLPYQLGIYLDWYLPLIALTLGVMIVDLVLARTRTVSDRRADDEGAVLPFHKIKIARPLVDCWVLRGLRRRKRVGRGLIGEFARYFVDVAGIPAGAFVLISVAFLVWLLPTIFNPRKQSRASVKAQHRRSYVSPLPSPISAPILEDPSEELEDGLQERRHKKKYNQPRPSLPRTLSAPDLLNSTLTSIPTHSHDLRNSPTMTTLSAASHRVRGASHFDFKTSTSGVATKAMKNELSRLVASVQDPLTRRAFDTEMQSFFLLFTRYLAEKAQSRGLEWDKISSPGKDQIVPYASLPPTQDYGLLDKLAVLKVNGGLGTSMGMTGAKSALEVKNEMTFLDLTVRQIEHLNTTYKVDVPMILMTSFNTHEDTLRIIKKYANQQLRITTFNQSRYPRILKETLLPCPQRADDDKKNWYPPGHGDLYNALLHSGVLDQLIADGKEYLFVSNSDNLGAVVDERILKHMIDTGSEFIMEVTDKTKADIKGGTLIDYEGQVRLLEIAQVPSEHTEEFKSIRKFKIFNTNNLWLNLKALKRVMEEEGMDLEIIINPKDTDDGKAVIQLETAAGAAIKHFKGAHGVNVPRSRFLPVKSCSDLLLIKSDIYSLEHGQLVLNEARMFDTIPVVKLGDHFKKIANFQKRFKSIPKIVELDHLTVTGDVNFGRNVTLRGTVIVVANEGQRIDIPDGCVLENRLVSGNLNLIEL